MKKKPQPSSRPTAITNAADAAIVKGMLKRGDTIHDVAAWFGMNSARIANVKNSKCEGAKWRDVPPAPLHTLPPPGPYPRPGETMAVIAALREENRVAGQERRKLSAMIEQMQRQLAALGRDMKLIDTKPPTPSRRAPLAG